MGDNPPRTKKLNIANGLINRVANLKYERLINIKACLIVICYDNMEQFLQMHVMKIIQKFNIKYNKK
jgi:hypothetical protein